MSFPPRHPLHPTHIPPNTIGTVTPARGRDIRRVSESRGPLCQTFGIRTRLSTPLFVPLHSVERVPVCRLLSSRLRPISGPGFRKPTREVQRWVPESPFLTYHLKSNLRRRLKIEQRVIGERVQFHRINTYSRWLNLSHQVETLFSLERL